MSSLALINVHKEIEITPEEVVNRLIGLVFQKKKNLIFFYNFVIVQDQCSVTPDYTLTIFPLLEPLNGVVVLTKKMYSLCPNVMSLCYITLCGSVCCT